MSFEDIYPSRQIIREIDWLERRIDELQPQLLRRSSTQRQINDLLRQIRERQKILDERRLA